MDALYFHVSSERQTTENQFADLLQVAEKDDSGRDWSRIREALSRCVVEEERLTRMDVFLFTGNSTSRTIEMLDRRATQGCDPSADSSPEWVAASRPPPWSARHTI